MFNLILFLNAMLKIPVITHNTLMPYIIEHASLHVSGVQKPLNTENFTFEDMFSGEYAYRTPFAQFVGRKCHVLVSMC